MDNLATKIRQELNAYQAQVSERLEELRRQGLLSQTELKKIIIDAQITGKAVVEGLALQGQYTEEATEIYVFSLLDRYKSKIEQKIRPLEARQKSSEIFIDGKSIPVYFEDEGGKLIIPSQLEKEISLNFLENALTTPVKEIKIVIGNMLRKIYLTPTESSFSFNSEAYQIRVEEENQRIQNIYQDFGDAISQLVNSDYPEEVKNLSKSKLLEKMQSRLSHNVHTKQKSKRKSSFLSNFLSIFVEREDDSTQQTRKDFLASDEE